MNRALRWLVCLLLAGAVPLQTLAAATMLGCGPQRGGQAATDPVQAHAHHGAMPSASDDAAPEPSHDHHAALSTSDTDDGSQARCSACASCCLGAAVLYRPIDFQDIALDDVFASLLPRSVAAFVTEGPERPPRTFLA